MVAHKGPEDVSSLNGVHGNVVAATKEHTADKLKERMNQWQSYVTTPLSPAAGSQTPAPTASARMTEERRGVDPLAQLGAVDAADGTGSTASTPYAEEARFPLPAGASSPLSAALPPALASPEPVEDPVARLARCEALIADLQAAVVREHEHTRRLSEAMVREQAHTRRLTAAMASIPQGMETSRKAWGIRPFARLGWRGGVGRHGAVLGEESLENQLYLQARKAGIVLSFCAILVIACMACLLALLIIR